MAFPAGVIVRLCCTTGSKAGCTGDTTAGSFITATGAAAECAIEGEEGIGNFPTEPLLDAAIDTDEDPALENLPGTTVGLGGISRTGAITIC